MTGSASELHARSAAIVSAGEAALTRTVALMQPDRPAVVLGSAQDAARVDQHELSRRGYDLARRRSGGGAVVVGPEDVVWIDVVVPASDPAWEDDVARASWWIGRMWADALSSLGFAATSVWISPMERSSLSAQVCFAGMGPGEVSRHGRKVVGVSQRRTKRGALFQTATLLRWEPADLVAILGLDAPGQGRVEEGLAGRAEGIGPDLAEPLWGALLDRLMP